MKMLTAAIKKKLPKIGATESTPLKEKRVIVKFFCPWNGWTWYVFEGTEMVNGDIEFFGMVEGFEKELGTFYLSELESVQGFGGLKIERDLHFGMPIYSEIA